MELYSTAVNDSEVPVPRSGNMSAAEMRNSLLSVAAINTV
jgi:hypothetical protein